MNIKICVPYYNPIHPACEESIQKALKDKEINFTVEREFGVYVGNNRNACVSKTAEIKQKLPKKIDSYLFVDSDIAFEVDDIKRLVKWNVGIISGAYLRRDTTDKVPAGHWLEGQIGITGEHYEFGTGLVKADFLPGGFLLVKKEELERLPYPWFRHELISNETEAIETGEDIGFSILCGTHKRQIWIDLGCKVEHLPTVKEGEDIFVLRKTKNGFNTAENWYKLWPKELTIVVGIIETAKISIISKLAIAEYERLKNENHKNIKGN